MSRASVTARGRVAAEAGMVDACTIRRRATTGTTDDNSGAVAPTWTDLYAGKCRVQQGSLGRGTQVLTPGQDYQLILDLELQLPISVTDLAVGDEVTITAAALDADLVGQVLVIRDLLAKTHLTARRVGVMRRTS